MSEFVPKKSLYSYNSEYSYKNWEEDKEEDNTDVFFELNCENGKRNITYLFIKFVVMYFCLFLKFVVNLI